MNANDEKWNNKELIELVLTLLAVIAGSIAAIGAFLGASYERQRVELERKPALFLSCQPEFRILDAAEGTKPATNTALLTDDGARWIHLDSNGHEDTPQPFASCSLTNYGQLPVFNLRMQVKLQTLGKYNLYGTANAFLDVPGLSPSSTYGFALINGTSGRITFAFEPLLTAMRVDTGTRTEVPLFLSEELIDLEHRIEEPQLRTPHRIARAESTDAAVVHIKDFRYGPSVLRVRTNDVITFANDDPELHTVTATGKAFDSGWIDSGARWGHRFTRPGTYTYICSFHPYMRGRIVVSDAVRVQTPLIPRKDWP